MAYNGGSGLSKPPPLRYVMLTEEYVSDAQSDVSSSDLTIYTKLVASFRAENPNDMTDIGYGTSSRTIGSYRGSTLCSDYLPVFYQGYRNTMVMRIATEGRHGFSSGLQSALEESKNAGNIPLDMYVNVPVMIWLGTVDLRQATVNANYVLVVDSPSPKKKPVIKSAQYKAK